MKRIIVALAVCLMLCGCAAETAPEVTVTKGENIAQAQPEVDLTLNEEQPLNEQISAEPIDKGEAVLNGDESKLLLGSGWSTIDSIQDVELTPVEPEPEVIEEPIQEEEHEEEVVEEPEEEESSIPLKRKNFWIKDNMDNEWKTRCKEIIDNGDIVISNSIAEASSDCIDKDEWLNQYIAVLCYDYIHKYASSDDTKYSWKDEIPEDPDELLSVLGLSDRNSFDSVYSDYLPTLKCNTNIWVVDQNAYFGNSSDYEVSFTSRKGFYHEDEEHELPHLWLPDNACDIIKIGDKYYYVLLYLNGTSSMDINGYVKYIKGEETRYMLVDYEQLALQCSEYVPINYNNSFIGYMVNADYISADTIKSIIDG